jgi:two-component system, NarL family, response regulator LiaR
MIRVLIVDDHAIVRQGLRLMLDAQPHIEVMGEADNSLAAIQRVQTQEPDLVLMDLLMPGMDGIEGIRQILAVRPQTRILVLTSSLEDQLVRQALQAGAHGYILKASRPLELLRAIEQVAQGSTALDPAASQVLIQQAKSNDPLDALTIRERDVFDAMARGLANPAIAENLAVSEGTVRTHIAAILDKLQLRDRTQVTIYALKRGLIRLEDLP